MKHPIHLCLLFGLLFLSALACGIPAATPAPVKNPPTADLNAFNTQIALTASAATPLPLGANTAVPPAQPIGDEQAIKQALAGYFSSDTSSMQVTVTASNGSTAYGVVVQSGAMEGAAWLAAKNANGQWVVVHVGQSWPPCAAIQPYSFPLDYVSHCEDASGNVIDRSSGQNSPLSSPTPAPANQTDSYPPDPLGAAWTGFWIDHGTCYDLDLFSAINDATCDISLDANNIFTPQNGALFDSSPYQYAPSLNTCKSAALTASPIDALNTTYVCFKTNAGRFGVFLPREIQAGGVVFDAYQFP